MSRAKSLKDLKVGDEVLLFVSAETVFQNSAQKQ